MTNESSSDILKEMGKPLELDNIAKGMGRLT